MSASEILWSLYHKKSDIQIDGLKLEQARALVSSLNPSNLNIWMAWHEGLDDWKNVSDFKELFEQAALKKVPPPPPKASQPNTHEPSDATGIYRVKAFTAQDIDLDDPEFILQKYSKDDSRRNSRFEKSFAVTIRFDQVKTECRTVNISLSGMKLDRLLPHEACHESITAEIRRRDAILILECRAIPDPNVNGSSRLIFIKISDEELLRGWILEPGGK